MSCGCKYPAAVQLRIVAMEFAVRSNRVTDPVEVATEIEKYLLGDAKLKDSPASAAKPPEDRLAMTHAPVDYLMRGNPALSPGQVARLKARHISTIGQLAITAVETFDTEQGCSPSHFVAHMSEVLARFGLRLGMEPDELDAWIDEQNA